MSALPLRISPAPATFELPVARDLPDYLPARMVNEFVYCPRSSGALLVCFSSSWSPGSLARAP